MASAAIHDLPVANPAEMERFFGDYVGDHIQIVVIAPDGQPLPYGRYFGSDATGAAVYAAEHNRKGFNVYWTANISRSNVHKKPKKPDIEAARFCHVDIDPPKDGSAWDRATVLKRLDDMRVPPSFVIDSGNGYQALWRLEERGGNLDAVEVLNRRIMAEFKADSCWNIDRLLRIPGSVNFPDKGKRERGRIPALASIAVEDSGELAEYEALHVILPPDPKPEERSRERSGSTMWQSFRLPISESRFLTHCSLRSRRPIRRSDPRQSCMSLAH